MFRALFRGRDDVYPRRFESRKTGKCGYQPACTHERVRGLCDKRAVKCAECPNRRFHPVTDEVVRWHLSGQDHAGNPFVMGLYPMLLDETCWQLAADFDKESWQEDTAAFLTTCRQMGLPVYLDQWAFLATVRKIGREQAEDIVREAENRGRIPSRPTQGLAAAGKRLSRVAVPGRGYRREPR